MNITSFDKKPSSHSEVTKRMFCQIFLEHNFDLEFPNNNVPNAMKQLGFSQHVTIPTTYYGSHVDLVYTKKYINTSVVDV